MSNGVSAVSSPSSGKVLFYLILTTFFWGGSFLFTKIGVREVPPPFFVLLRFSLAAVLMGLLCLPRLARLDRQTVRRGTIVGLALGVTNLTFVVGVQGTSISRAGVINNLFVLFIPLIARTVWKDRIGRINIAGIGLASLGIALLASGGGEGFNRGDMISTLCAFFIAIHIITVSKVLKDEDVWLVSLVQFCVVALMGAVTVLLVPTPSFSLGLTSLGTIIYCAIFPTVVCFTLQNRYQRYVTPTQAGLIYTLDPVWSLLAGFVVLGERLAPREWYGCGLIFLAVLIPLGVRFVIERRLVVRYLQR
ncbi:Threonine/homoserine efflux transporter RhtA [Trichlorobacter thiogenes]|uniref:Threonine/homoserine efflux transporter RhtA n=1 Tax=Trichlorobacter thiogenes TaxID=115783 RepID=A0A1T4RDR8_9BACT|nr:DMT family transporter [Trichlorobacter thiogenes]SKA13888.1 Threonine/homoserine efflux transporter RhtA [Trichlorobacter thiogenes]